MKKINTFFKAFFIWCSGASSDIVMMCDHKEQTKYVNIGIVVLAVALLSIFSSTFFLSFAFDTTGASFNWTYFPIGVIWGAIILSLDRAIVATINKLESIFLQIIKSIPRILLAFTIGIIVATPLEFKIFEKEINDIMYNNAMDIIKYDTDDKYAEELKMWRAKVEDAEKIYNDDKQMYQDEITGKKSGIPGKGARADEYMKNELRSLKLLNEYKDSLYKIEQTIVNMNKDIDFDKEAREYMNINYGVLERVDVLYSIGFVHTIVGFLFILIETLPVLIKLMSPVGSYDHVSVTQKNLYIKRNNDEYENELLELQLKTDLLKAKNNFRINKIKSDNSNDIKLREAENDINIKQKISENYKNIKLSEAENDINIHKLKSEKIKEIKTLENKNKNTLKLKDAETKSNITLLDTETKNKAKQLEKEMEINILNMEAENDYKEKYENLHKRERILVKREQKLKERLETIKNKSTNISETEEKAKDLLTKVEEREKEIEKRKEILRSKFDEVKNKETELKEWEKSLNETNEKIEKWEKMYWKFKRKNQN